MAVQRNAKHLGALDAQVNPTIFDTGNSGLGDAAQGGELCLAEPLQLTDDAYRFTRRDVDAFFGGNEFFHVSVSGSHGA